MIIFHHKMVAIIIQTEKSINKQSLTKKESNYIGLFIQRDVQVMKTTSDCEIRFSECLQYDNTSG